MTGTVLHRVSCAAFAKHGCMSALVWRSGPTDVVVDERGRELLTDNGWTEQYGRWVCPVEHGSELPRALLARVGANRLQLTLPYLNRRAIDARSTSRRDQAEALEVLAGAIADAIAYAEAEAQRRAVLDDEACEADPDEGRDLDDEDARP